MYKITNFIQKLIIIICCSILLLFAGAKLKSVLANDNKTTKKFNGNYPTLQVRELWQVCSLTFQQKHPGLPQALRWLVCDCYTDIIRRDYTPEQAARQGAGLNEKELTVTLINECNGLLPTDDIHT